MKTLDPEPRWLDEDDRDAWGAIARMLMWLPAALDDQLQRDSGLSHYEYGILAALSAAEAATLRMSELAIYANGSLSRLSRGVARLERRGRASAVQPGQRRGLRRGEVALDGLGLAQALHQ